MSALARVYAGAGEWLPAEVGDGLRRSERALLAQLRRRARRPRGLHHLDIEHRCGTDVGLVEIGTAALAECTGYSRATVSVCRRRLAAHGLIQIARQGTGLYPTLYLVPLGKRR